MMGEAAAVKTAVLKTAGLIWDGGGATGTARRAWVRIASGWKAPT